MGKEARRVHLPAMGSLNATKHPDAHPSDRDRDGRRCDDRRRSHPVVRGAADLCICRADSKGVGSRRRRGRDRGEPALVRLDEPSEFRTDTHNNQGFRRATDSDAST